jgi:hypothetical protein
MKQIKVTASDSQGPEGIFLVRIKTASRHWRGRKPVLHLGLAILAPPHQRSQTIVASLDCSSKNQWKLRWFLRDFGCPPDLNDSNAVDLQTLRGLTGVVRTSLNRARGDLSLNLEGFSSASTWPEFEEVIP